MTTQASPDVERLPGSVLDGLARIGAAAVGPFGPTPLRRLVAAHLPLFAELRRLRAGWSQIAALIAVYGVVAGDEPVDTDVLRATYASARAEAAARTAAKCDGTQRNETKRNETKRNETQRNETKRSAAQHYGADGGGSADGDDPSSLRNRAKLLNRPTRTR